METKEQVDIFRNELMRRFDELVHWAVDNWPDQSRPLTAVDFVEMREKIAVAGAKPGEAEEQDLEPSEGGPQYRQVTPAPWP
jgi:hypothetical protein